MSASALNTAKTRLESDLRRWLQPILQRLAAVPMPRWRQLALLVLSAWILANLARLIWLLLPASSAPAAAPVVPANPVAVQNRTLTQSTAIDIERLVGWHLFGEAGAARIAAAGAIEAQAQDTSLNLQLVGLVQSSEEARARDTAAGWQTAAICDRRTIARQRQGGAGESAGRSRHHRQQRSL